MTQLNDEPVDYLQHLMRERADSAVAAAKGAYAVDLDFSFGNLKVFDGLLQRMHEENQTTPIPSERLELLVFAFGAYVGEVIRRHLGRGIWRQENGLALGFDAESGIWPLAWVQKRIINGAEDDIVFKADVAVKVATGEL